MWRKISVMQHFYANSISEITDLEEYQENPNFLAKNLGKLYC